MYKTITGMNADLEVQKKPDILKEIGSGSDKSGTDVSGTLISIII